MAEASRSDSLPVLEVRNIVKTYGGVKALDDVSMALTAGNVHCLAGENGCGKSTLIKIISGVEQPDSGSVYIDGKLHEKLSPFSSIMAGIQVIYQDFSLFPNLSVAENITITSQVANRAKLFFLLGHISLLVAFATLLDSISGISLVMRFRSLFPVRSMILPAPGFSRTTTVAVAV